MVDRWGEYFDGGMGADAIARLIESTDFDNEEVKLRSMIDPLKARSHFRTAEAEGDQAPQDRGRLQPS